MTGSPNGPKSRGLRSKVFITVGILGLIVAGGLTVYFVLSNSSPAPSTLKELPLITISKPSKGVNSPLMKGVIRICVTNPVELDEVGYITLELGTNVQIPPTCPSGMMPALTTNQFKPPTGDIVSSDRFPSAQLTVFPSDPSIIDTTALRTIYDDAPVQWQIFYQPNTVKNTNFSVQLTPINLTLPFTVNIERNLFQQIQYFFTSAQSILVGFGAIASAIVAIVGLIERVRKLRAPAKP